MTEPKFNEANWDRVFRNWKLFDSVEEEQAATIEPIATERPATGSDGPDPT